MSRVNTVGSAELARGPRAHKDGKISEKQSAGGSSVAQGDASRGRVEHHQLVMFSITRTSTRGPLTVKLS